jgi:hypothetical protein
MQASDFVWSAVISLISGCQSLLHASVLLLGVLSFNGVAVVEA